MDVQRDESWSEPKNIIMYTYSPMTYDIILFSSLYGAIY